MIHEVFPVGPLQCNCSVIGDEETREAIVIDPGAEIERIEAVLAEHGLTVKWIVVTHAHIDHIGGAGKLRTRTGAPILMNENDSLSSVIWISRPHGSACRSRKALRSMPR